MPFPIRVLPLIASRAFWMVVLQSRRDDKLRETRRRVNPYPPLSAGVIIKARLRLPPSKQMPSKPEWSHFPFGCVIGLQQINKLPTAALLSSSLSAAPIPFALYSSPVATLLSFRRGRKKKRENTQCHSGQLDSSILSSELNRRYRHISNTRGISTHLSPKWLSSTSTRECI